MTRNAFSIHDQVSLSDRSFETIEAVRSRLVNTLLIACSITAVPTLGISILRVKDIGWQPLFSVQIGVTAILWGATLFRAHLTFYQRSAIVIGLLGLFGIGGLLTFGLIGNGVVLFLLTCFTTAILFDRRIGLGVTAAGGLIVLITGIAVSQGLLRFHINLDAYATSFLSWLTASVTLCAFTAIIVAGLGRMNEALTNSIRTLALRTAELQRTNDRLKGEIEERKHMEEQLRESEKKFSTIFHLSPDALVISRIKDGLFFDISQGFTDLTGYTKDDVTGKTGLDIDIWANPAVRSRLQNAFQEGQGSARIEAEFRSKHGEIRTGDVTATLVHIQGEPCMFTNVKDINERKRTEEELKRSEEKFRVLTEMALVGIYIIQDGVLVYVNPSFARTYGYSPEAIMHRLRPQDLVHRDDKPRLMKNLQDRLAGRIPQHSYIYKAIKKDGSLIHIEVYSLLIDYQGRPAVMGTLMDITERKRAEEKLKQYQGHLEDLVRERTAELQRANNVLAHEIDEREQVEEALRESEKMYRLLAENSTDVIWILDDENRFSYISPSILQLRGYTPEETIQQSFAETMTPESLARVQALRKKRKDGDESILRLEIEQLCKDGSTVWVEATSKPLWDEHGHRIGILGTSHDITERKRAEKALKQAKEKAEDAQREAETANKAKSTFLANMSHELRTPLNAIIGFSQLLVRRHDLDDEPRAYLEIITRSGGLLLTLINQVLDLSKIEAGRMPVTLQDFDLYAMLDELEDLFRLRAAEKQLQLHFEYSPDVPQYLRTDAVKLRQILINLLNNAVKFTEEGKIQLSVNSEQSSEQPAAPNTDYCLLFTIQDTGSGMSAEELDSLFEAFTQTATGQQIQEGTGLGLTISRQFVEMLGGEMIIRSQIAHGTTVTFSVQAEKIEPLDEHPHEDRRILALVPDQPCYRLLVVDDKADNRLLLVKLLEAFELDVKEAQNGQEALDIWEYWHPHLIFMDLRMPVLSGYDAIKKIRAVERGSASVEKAGLTGMDFSVSAPPKAVNSPPGRGGGEPASPDSLTHPLPLPAGEFGGAVKGRTVIVAVTSSVFERQKADVLALGCDDFVRKPFHDSEIFEVMQKHLGIQYIYEEDEEHEAYGAGHVSTQDLTPLLATLAPELLDSVEQAMLQLNRKAILQALEGFEPRHADLAEALIALTEEFKYEEILNHIDEAKKI